MQKTFKLYTVNTLTGNIVAEIKIKAESKEEAIKLAKEDNFYSITSDNLENCKLDEKNITEINYDIN